MRERKVWGSGGCGSRSLCNTLQTVHKKYALRGIFGNKVAKLNIARESWSGWYYDAGNGGVCRLRYSQSLYLGIARASFFDDNWSCPLRRAEITSPVYTKNTVKLIRSGLSHNSANSTNLRINWWMPLSFMYTVIVSRVQEQTFQNLQII